MPRFPAELSARLGLRFAAELEALYRADREVRANPTRIALGLLAVAMVALTPAYDLLTRPPAEFNALARILQFGLELPVTILALLSAGWRPLRPWSGLAVLLAASVVAAGVIAQRAIGHALGFDVPYALSAVVVAAVAVMGGFRFWLLLGWSSLVVGAACAVELSLAGSSGAAIYNSFAMLMLLSMLMTGAYALERAERSNWLDRRQLRDLACRDGLTGLANRRHFDASLERLAREAAREHKTLALLLIDIDHFKAYNDCYGHPTGDNCLRAIAARLELGMRRPGDFCARIGGEEFAAVWFDALPASAPGLAEELRAGIAGLAIPHAGGAPSGVVTASAGLVRISAPAAGQSAPELAAEMMRRADQALYAAKAAGRDRLVVAEAG
ncbi:MAG: GGDEF domain-containing protein [Stagnimonas sp.]|nr:GGDEF domain-containing protein [Stagnimonas sp.]